MSIELAAGVTMLASFGANSWLGRVALRRGWCDPVGPLKTHTRPVPFVGGLGVMLALIVGSAFVSFHPSAPPPSALLSFLACAAVGLVLGLWDDFRWKSLAVPRAKLALQVAAASLMACILALAGIRPLAHAFAFSLPVSAAFLLGGMNALNLEDGMDGLAGGEAALSALGFAVWAGLSARAPVAAAALTLAAALTGFLVLNWHPARLFLGDGGSHMVGATLAALGIAAVAATGLTGLPGAVLVIGLPVLDTAWVILRRLVSGHRVMSGDRAHLYDVMHRRLSTRQTVLVCWLIQAALTSCGVALLLNATP
jgi:UDP-GlcNAc:undecaprenyl-phosphate GlcNAc-1-phosphate transferase